MQAIGSKGTNGQMKPENGSNYVIITKHVSQLDKNVKKIHFFFLFEFKVYIH